MLESPAPEAIERERFEVLRQLEDWMEVPLLLLGFAWLALLAFELTYGAQIGRRGACDTLFPDDAPRAFNS